MLFLRPMYPRWLNIHCCRCSFWNQCICNLLFFELADTFKPACHVNCIYILPFLWPEDASRRNFASSTCSFHNLQILHAKILHPQPVLSITCRYFPQKFGIFNPKKSTIADISPYSLNSMAWANTLPTKNWYKKFERIWNERWWHLERKFLR